MTSHPLDSHVLGRFLQFFSAVDINGTALYYNMACYEISGPPFLTYLAII